MGRIIMEELHMGDSGHLTYDMVYNPAPYSVLFGTDVLGYVRNWLKNQNSRGKGWKIVDDCISGPNGCPMPDGAIVVGHNGIPSWIFYDYLSTFSLVYGDINEDGFEYRERIDGTAWLADSQDVVELKALIDDPSKIFWDERIGWTLNGKESIA